MSFVFFVEVDNKQPKYLMKTTSSQDTISIYRSTETDVVLVGEHRDRIYQNKIEKCKDLDCSQFYTSAFATGAVSLCADCEEFIPGGGGGGESGPCSAYGILNSVNFTPPSAATPLNNSNPSGSLSSYNSWVSNSTNQALARSGYWLGMNTCNGGGSQFQCLVSCSTGAVAGCFSNSGSGSVGDVHVIGGSSYQVYDAMQLVTGGMSIPSSGTVPLLSGNPTNSGTYSGTSCGRVITTIDFKTGGDSNCLTDNGHNDKCTSCMDNNSPITGTLPTSSPEQFPNSIALFGDYSHTVLGTESSCYFVGGSGGSNGAKASTSVARFALGGSTTGGVTPTTLGAAGLTSSGSCGECIGKMLSDSGGSKGPGCCLSACNRIGINGAPTTTDGGSTWSEGSAIWSNFWPDDEYDQNYRNPGDNNGIRAAWSSCFNNVTIANSIYSLPCNPTSKCDTGDPRNFSIIETIYAGSSTQSCCGGNLYSSRASCLSHNGGTPVINCGDDCAPGAPAAIQWSACSTKKTYTPVLGISTDCRPSGKCQGTVKADYTQGSTCTANIPIAFDQFYTKIVYDDYTSLSDDIFAKTTGYIIGQLPGKIETCSTPGAGQAVGQVVKLSVTGKTDNLCAGPEEPTCPRYASTSGYFSLSSIRSLMALGYTNTGSSGEQTMSSDDTSTCCSFIIQSPWLPPEGTDDSWNYKNCENTGDPHENWVEEVFDKNSSCLGDPCIVCP